MMMMKEANRMVHGTGFGVQPPPGSHTGPHFPRAGTPKK